jgi:hypothetical protein
MKYALYASLLINYLQNLYANIHIFGGEGGGLKTVQTGDMPDRLNRGHA